MMETKMGQITVSLPEDIESRIRRHADEQGYQTLSSLVTEVLRERLDGNGRLDYWTRVGLVLELENNRLLSALAQGKSHIKDENWDFRRAYDALREGYVSEYPDTLQYVYSVELDKSSANYVMDTLAMYEDLQWSCEENKDSDTTKVAVFPGYDGNHQTSFLGFAQYLAKNRQFAHIEKRFPDFNAHSMTPDYRSMLDTYNEIRRKKNRNVALTKEEILTILGR
jgi:uncharacterized protein YfbU (UPF0304 family)